ncbi:ATP synthase subunit C lysine N-methyltransferase isoform X1 [Diprion similis]|uniref:ATP synthase subunit C lysine N-methyltransferase isoform X1 n=2 Tax=Diprion similis TaxID=362088 RepID=UPI001EF90C8F|nr:ATP synthase subunit C lysine N-methyltransferase isoform X1 [Diprion similis]
MKELQLENEELSSGVQKRTSNIGLIFVGLTGGAAVAISAVCLPFVSPALRKVCLPYVPATTQQVENVLQALKGRSGTLVDLGSGDGRIVMAAAKKGFKADGVELNPWLIAYSRFTAITRGLSTRVTFFRKDLWKFNLKKYDNVVIFGVQQMMDEVEEKFNSELKRDSLIIACRFPLPNLEPVAILGHGVDTVWVYKSAASSKSNNEL